MWRVMQAWRLGAVGAVDATGDGGQAQQRTQRVFVGAGMKKAYGTKGAVVSDGGRAQQQQQQQQAHPA